MTDQRDFEPPKDDAHSGRPLGVVLVSPQGSNRYGEPPPGPVVHSVDRDSAAQRAGLKPGDMILEVDGIPTHKLEQASKDLAGALFSYLKTCSWGHRFIFRLKRDNEYITLEV